MYTPKTAKRAFKASTGKSHTKFHALKAQSAIYDAKRAKYQREKNAAIQKFQMNTSSKKTGWFGRELSQETLKSTFKKAIAKINARANTTQRKENAAIQQWGEKIAKRANTTNFTLKKTDPAGLTGPARYTLAEQLKAAEINFEEKRQKDLQESKQKAINSKKDYEAVAKLPTFNEAKTALDISLSKREIDQTFYDLKLSILTQSKDSKLNLETFKQNLEDDLKRLKDKKDRGEINEQTYNKDKAMYLKLSDNTVVRDTYNTDIPRLKYQYETNRSNYSILSKKANTLNQLGNIAKKLTIKQTPTVIPQAERKLAQKVLDWTTPEGVLKYQRYKTNGEQLVQNLQYKLSPDTIKELIIKLDANKTSLEDYFSYIKELKSQNVNISNTEYVVLRKYRKYSGVTKFIAESAGAKLNSIISEKTAQEAELKSRLPGLPKNYIPGTQQIKQTDLADPLKPTEISTVKLLTLFKYETNEEKNKIENQISYISNLKEPFQTEKMTALYNKYGLPLPQDTPNINNFSNERLMRYIAASSPVFSDVTVKTTLETILKSTMPDPNNPSQKIYIDGEYKNFDALLQQAKLKEGIDLIGSKTPKFDFDNPTTKEKLEDITNVLTKKQKEKLDPNTKTYIGLANIEAILRDKVETIVKILEGNDPVEIQKLVDLGYNINTQQPYRNSIREKLMQTDPEIQQELKENNITGPLKYSDLNTMQDTNRQNLDTQLFNYTKEKTSIAEQLSKFNTYYGANVTPMKTEYESKIAEFTKKYTDARGPLINIPDELKQKYKTDMETYIKESYEALAYGDQVSLPEVPAVKEEKNANGTIKTPASPSLPAIAASPLQKPNITQQKILKMMLAYNKITDEQTKIDKKILEIQNGDLKIINDIEAKLNET